MIKPADKGGGLVLLDRKDFKFEVYRQLEDEVFYRKLHTDPTQDTVTFLK